MRVEVKGWRWGCQKGHTGPRSRPGYRCSRGRPEVVRGGGVERKLERER